MTERILRRACAPTDFSFSAFEDCWYRKSDGKRFVADGDEFLIEHPTPSIRRGGVRMVRDPISGELAPETTQEQAKAAQQSTFLTLDGKYPGQEFISAPPTHPGRPSDVEFERELVSKGLTAPRVTPAGIEAIIAGEYYFTGLDGALKTCNRSGSIEAAVPHHRQLGLLTFCVLVLKNGFTVTGESACASPENFNAAAGQKAARNNAIGKIWPLEGYLLREKLHRLERTGGISQGNL